MKKKNIVKYGLSAYLGNTPVREGVKIQTE